ncbi:MAG: hypothetical protein JWO80_2147 [Bryobacterales bacterium]|nr:hypothetical protein [Bryobacterales bacterium]
MAKLTDENKRISDLIAELVDSARELSHSEDKNSALTKELAECRTAADSDNLLLASGLRLCFENELLQAEMVILRKDAARQAPDQKTSKASQAQP